MGDDQTAAGQWAALWETYMHENRALRARAEAAEARAAQAEAAGYRRAVDDACAAVRAEHKQALEEHRKQSDHEWRSENYGRLSALREVECVVRALAPVEPVSPADGLPGGAA